VIDKLTKKYFGYIIKLFKNKIVGIRAVIVNVITMLKELSDIVIHNNRLEKNIGWIIWIKNL
ncbi:hypothetical protein, partial [Thomasclavelia cocleata]|uniref:hypothetical protein n=1 Tax=Thomasclavelia cocleata TaxID=69824 RepID=UPI00242C387E